MGGFLKGSKNYQPLIRACHHKCYLSTSTGYLPANLLTCPPVFIIISMYVGLHGDAPRLPVKSVYHSNLGDYSTVVKKCYFQVQMQPPHPFSPSMMSSSAGKQLDWHSLHSQIALLSFHQRSLPKCIKYGETDISKYASAHWGAMASCSRWWSLAVEDGGCSLLELLTIFASPLTNHLTRQFYF